MKHSGCRHLSVSRRKRVVFVRKWIISTTHSGTSSRGCRVPAAISLFPAATHLTRDIHIRRSWEYQNLCDIREVNVNLKVAGYGHICGNSASSEWVNWDWTEGQSLFSVCLPQKPSKEPVASWMVKFFATNLTTARDSPLCCDTVLKALL